MIWVIVAIDAWYLWPAQLGGSTSMVIVSGISMEPTYFDGDLVITREVTPSVGDVIVYAPEGLGGAQIVHRIIGGNATDGWQMQGDNNDFIDPFTPKGDEVKGVVMVHYANFGRVTVLLLNPIVWAFVLLAAIVLLLWWGGDTCEDDPEDPDASTDASADGGEPSDSTDEAAVPPTTSGDAPVTEDAPEKPAAEPAAPRGGTIAGLLRAGAAVSIVVLALGLAPTPASASQVSVNTSGTVAALKMQRCASAALTATVAGPVTGSNYGQVSVSGVPAACAGLPMTVNIHRANGTVITTATGTAAAGTTTLATAAAYNGSQVTRVVVALRGWLFFPTWTGPTVPAASCVALNAAGNPISGACTVTINTVDTPWPDGAGFATNYYYSVTSAGPRFRVTFNYAQAPFPGWTPVRVGGHGTLAPGATCTTLPVVTINGPTWSSGSYWGQISSNPAGSTGGICP